MGQTAKEAVPAAFERHFSPEEVAELWGFHPSTIRRMFVDEDGVLTHGEEMKPNGRRGHVTIRIPASVVERVHARRTR